MNDKDRVPQSRQSRANQCIQRGASDRARGQSLAAQW